MKCHFNPPQCESEGTEPFENPKHGRVYLCKFHYKTVIATLNAIHKATNGGQKSFIFEGKTYRVNGQ